MRCASLASYAKSEDSMLGAISAVRRRWAIQGFECMQEEEYAEKSPKGNYVRVSGPAARSGCHGAGALEARLR